VENPGVSHLTAVKRILRYLSGTKDICIHYRRHQDYSLPPPLIAYADSDFAGDLVSRRSTTGAAISFAGGPVFFKSKRQSTVSLSTTEAEVVALTDCAREVKYLRNLLQDLQLLRPGPTTIFEDNLAAVTLSQDLTYRGRMRHLDVGHRYVQELASRGEVTVKYVNSADQIADIFTKALPPSDFISKRKRLGIY